MSNKPENKRILPRLKGLSPIGKGASAGSRDATKPQENGQPQSPPSASAPSVSANGNGSQAAAAAPQAAEKQVVVVQAPSPVEQKPQNCWQRFMSEWPGGLQRQGVVITNWDEQVPFSSFLTNEEMVMFERRNPDTNGARRLLIGYDAIKAVKIVEVVKDVPFLEAGFVGPNSERE